jgi:beta-lactamase regulating signal transducer with metallopeptidase domain
MGVISEALSSDLVYHLGWMLLHSLWLITALAVVVWVTLKLIPKQFCNLRYGLSCAAMLLMMASLALTTLWVPERSERVDARVLDASALDGPHTADRAVLAPHSQDRESKGQGVEVADALPYLDLPPDSSMPSLSASLASDSALEEYAVGTEALGWQGGVVEVARRWVAWIVPVWLMGVFVMGVWHLGGFIAVHRLRLISTRKASRRIQSLLDTMSDRMGVRQTVTLLESAVVQTPVVIGWLKPVILLPTSVLTGMPSEQIEVIIAHELAHIRRHDYIVNLIQTVVVTLLFYHPAIWWVSSQIRTERECCCDEMVVKRTDRHLDYAMALAHVAKMHSDNPGLAVAASSGSLLERLQRLAGLADAPGLSPKAWVACLLLLIVAVTLPITVATGLNDEQVIDASVVEDDDAGSTEPLQLQGIWIVESNQAGGEPIGVIHFRPDGKAPLYAWAGDVMGSLAAEGIETTFAWSQPDRETLTLTPGYNGQTEGPATIRLAFNGDRLTMVDGNEPASLLRVTDHRAALEMLKDRSADPANVILGTWYGQFVDGRYLPGDRWCTWEFRQDGKSSLTRGRYTADGTIDSKRGEVQVADYRIDDQGRLVLYVPGEETKRCPFEIHDGAIYISVDQENDYVLTREQRPESFAAERERASAEQNSRLAEAAQPAEDETVPQVSVTDPFDFWIAPASFEPTTVGTNNPAQRVPGQNRPVYRTDAPLITLNDIAQAKIVEGAKTGPMFDLRLKTSASQRLQSHTREHLGEPILVSIGGEIVSAPIIQAQQSGHIQLTIANLEQRNSYQSVVKLLERVAADRKRIVGTWMTRHSNETEGPDYSLLTLSEDGQYTTAYVWGTPEEPTAVKVTDRRTGWDLNLSAPMFVFGEEPSADRPFYSLNLRLDEQSSIGGGSLYFIDEDTLKSVSFESVLVESRSHRVVAQAYPELFDAFKQAEAAYKAELAKANEQDAGEQPGRSDTVVIHELVKYTDGGTLGVAYTPPGSERIEIAIDARDSSDSADDNTYLRLYVGAMHPDHEAARLADEGSQLEKQVFAALGSWVDTYFTGAEIEAIFNEANLDDLTETQAWAIWIERTLQAVRYHRDLREFAIFPASYDKQEGGHQVATSTPETKRPVYYTKQTQMLTLDDIADAKLVPAERGDPLLQITLKPEGAKRLEEHTRCNQADALLVMIDGKTVCAPIICGTKRAQFEIISLADDAQERFKGLINLVHERARNKDAISIKPPAIKRDEPAAIHETTSDAGAIQTRSIDEQARKSATLVMGPSDS